MAHVLTVCTVHFVADETQIDASSCVIEPGLGPQRTDDSNRIPTGLREW